ncbi:hypothetical protein BKA93DRAFT_731940, partial [Sparassis latifolia]
FTVEHPQKATHQVRLLAEADSLVPNFVGGLLPRCDTDREEYCLTMLDANTSWHNTFDEYKFTPRQLELMKFFHIRYECNDARDNFAAARKAGKFHGQMPFGMDDNAMNELDIQYQEDEATAGVTNDLDLMPESDDWNQVGEKMLIRISSMLQAERIMQTSG